MRLNNQLRKAILDALVAERYPEDCFDREIEAVIAALTPDNCSQIAHGIALMEEAPEYVIPSADPVRFLFHDSTGFFKSMWPHDEVKSVPLPYEYAYKVCGIPSGLAFTLYWKGSKERSKVECRYLDNEIPPSVMEPLDRFLDRMIERHQWWRKAEDTLSKCLSVKEVEENFPQAAGILEAIEREDSEGGGEDR